MASIPIGPDKAPALGDVRALGAGDSIFLRKGWGDRRDAGRYADAICAAIARGADVRWVRRGA